MKNEDVALIEGFKAGNHESFERLMIKYRLPAARFASRYLKDGYAVEEAVQESFAALYVSRDKFNEEFSFKTYLFSIIKNKCIDYLRRKTALPLDESCISIAPSPETEVIMRERRNYVRMKLNQLKEDYRTVLYLKEYENFSYAEIAEIMGRNLGQVKILIYRARKSLKAMLESEV